MDNFENYMVVADIVVKVSHALGATDNLPDSSDYKELNIDLNRVMKNLKHSTTYFSQN